MAGTEGGRTAQGLAHSDITPFSRRFIGRQCPSRQLSRTGFCDDFGTYYVPAEAKIEMGKGGREKVLREFNIERMIDTYVNTIESLSR